MGSVVGYVGSVAGVCGLSSWGMWASVPGVCGLSSWGMGLSSWDMWAQYLGHVGSVVGYVGSVVGARELSSYSSQALEHRLNSCSSQALLL